MNRISLVMGTMGRSKEPLIFMESLATQTAPIHELIIIDQNDDERLSPLDLKAKELNIPSQRFKETIKNLSHSRNIGIVKTTGDIIGFPDDDCWYEPDVIEQVKDFFNAHPTIDAISGLWLEAPPQNLPKGIVLSNNLLAFKGAQINSNTFFIRRNVLYELCGFDPRLGTGQWFGSAEETDLVFRLASKGKQLHNVPEVKVHHPYIESYSRIRKYSRGTGALYAKHQLPIQTILRGILAPLFKCIYLTFSPTNKYNDAHLTLGRIEGFLYWHFKYGSGTKTWDTHYDVKLFNTMD